MFFFQPILICLWPPFDERQAPLAHNVLARFYLAIETKDFIWVV